MIDKRSRYQTTPIVELHTGESEPLRLIGLRSIPAIPSVFSLVPIATDRLDLLANQHYRDSTQFFRICDASDKLDPFDVIEIGVPLPIPPQR